MINKAGADGAVRKEEIEGFLDVLQRGMRGSARRGFMNDAFPASAMNCMRAMQIFCRADTEVFVEKYPELCPEFTALFRELQ